MAERKKEKNHSIILRGLVFVSMEYTFCAKIHPRLIPLLEEDFVISLVAVHMPFRRITRLAYGKQIYIPAFVGEKCGISTNLYLVFFTKNVSGGKSSNKSFSSMEISL